MRLIDADALAKFIDYGHLNNPNEKLYSENDIREMIDMMPTQPFDAVPVRHGYWQITDAYPHNVHCSVCHKRFAQTHWGVWEDGSLPRNYCPNCGARMDEE